MTTTPQLPPELEKQFDEKFKHDFRDGGSSSCYGGKDCDCWVKDAKHFLAQALEDQKNGYRAEVEKLPIAVGTPVVRSKTRWVLQSDVLELLKGENEMTKQTVCSHVGDKTNFNPQFCKKCGVEFLYDFRHPTNPQIPTMTKQTSTTQDWQERFDQLAGKGTTFDDWLNHDGCSPGMMKHFIATELAKAKADERREILALLKNVETAKWKDAEHCTCLPYAIDKIEKRGEK